MKRKAITRPTAARSAVGRAGFQACAWLVSQARRIWDLIRWWLDIVFQFSPAAADDETGRPSPLPARVCLSFLPPDAGIGHEEVPTSLTVRSLIDDLCRTQSGAKNHRHRPTRRRETPSKIFYLLSSPTLSHGYCRLSAFPTQPFRKRLLGFEGEPVALEEKFVIFFGFALVR